LLASPFKDLLDEGISMKESIGLLLSKWPRDDAGEALYWSDTPQSYQVTASEFVIRVRQWFNSVNQIVMPLVLHDKMFLYYTLRQVEAAVRKRQYRRASSELPTGGLPPTAPEFSRRAEIEIESRLEIAQQEAADGMETALDLIRSVPSAQHQLFPPTLFAATAAAPPPFQPNTAFILMWLDKMKPELEDVSNTIKSICRDFGVRAFRADDVEHQEVITEIVLNSIRTAEFLIADLSGERPNVYYEVGYAHAIGKRPLLFRKTGAHLHFDLSVHNVPEYKNVTELGAMLRRRLEAITGRNISEKK
jgi:hypothetical protein